MTRKELEEMLIKANRKITALELFINKNIIGASYRKLEISKLVKELEEAHIENQILKEENNKLEEKLNKKKKSASSLRHTKGYKEFRLKILERDGNKCTKCGSDKKLQIHHKKSVGEYPDLVLDENNVITLCAKCHTETDSYLRS